MSRTPYPPPRLISITLGAILAIGHLSAGFARADIAAVVTWAVSTANPTPYDLTLHKGETVILAPDYDIDLTGATNAVLRYRAVGSTGTVSSITGSVYNATSGVARIRMDVTNAAGQYQYEISVNATNATLLRSYGTITVLDSLSRRRLTPAEEGRHYAWISERRRNNRKG